MFISRSRFNAGAPQTLQLYTLTMFSIHPASSIEFSKRYAHHAGVVNRS
jgi:hypothetical protein